MEEIYKTDLTLIYDEDLCLLLGLKYNILPCDTLRSMGGQLCGVFRSSPLLLRYIAEYEMGDMTVDLRAFREYEDRAQIELAQSGL